MDFKIFTKFSFLQWWGFLNCFLKILVIMNDIQFVYYFENLETKRGKLIINFAWCNSENAHTNFSTTRSSWLANWWHANDITLVLQIYITKVILRNQFHVGLSNWIPSEMILYAYFTRPFLICEGSGTARLILKILQLNNNWSKNPC